MNEPTGFAFYDFDNTVIHGDIGPLFGDYMIGARHEQVMKTEGRKAADRDRARLIARYLPYMTWLGVQAGLYKLRAVRRSKLTRYAYKALKGIPSSDYYGLMEEFVNQELPDRIYKEVVESMQEHQAAGREVIIITTGVETLVKKCLPHLPGSIEVIGCRLHEKDGVFTGKVDGPLYGADKANIISAYCRSADVNLADCWAYSDHYSDYHMLEAVGHGVCINPRSRLTRLAQEKGWLIMEPRSPMEG